MDIESPRPLDGMYDEWWDPSADPLCYRSEGYYLDMLRTLESNSWRYDPGVSGPLRIVQNVLIQEDRSTPDSRFWHGQVLFKQDVFGERFGQKTQLSLVGETAGFLLRADKDTPRLFRLARPLMNIPYPFEDKHRTLSPLPNQAEDWYPQETVRLLQACNIPVDEDVFMANIEQYGADIGWPEPWWMQ